MSTRCQVQYLHPHRRVWVDCAKNAPITMVIAGTERVVCFQHRDEVRRAEVAGLVAGLRWSDQPSPPPQRLGVPAGQLQLVDIPATGRKRRRSR
jgi:hypothetical protein